VIPHAGLYGIVGDRHLALDTGAPSPLEGARQCGPVASCGQAPGCRCPPWSGPRTRAIAALPVAGFGKIAW